MVNIFWRQVKSGWLCTCFLFFAVLMTFVMIPTYALASETGRELEVDLNSGAPRDGDFIAVHSSIRLESGNRDIFMTGLKEGNKEKVLVGNEILCKSDW